MRVLHWHVGPHEKVPMHEHPAYVQISLTGGHGRFTSPDGKTGEEDSKAGQTRWNEPQKHSYENLSDSPDESFQVELKGKGTKAKPTAKKKG